VRDAPILIELANWSLLEDIFQLPLEFAVPDALYEDELLDLSAVHRERLKRLGLRVEVLDPAGMAQALAYRSAKPKLTIHDCFAVTLAVTHGWPLLTGDKRMRALAEEERVEVHGVLWVIDALAEYAVVNGSRLGAVLRGMLDAPRTHLPHAEIHKRLTRLV